jgi:hypothetical protein
MKRKFFALIVGMGLVVASGAALSQDDAMGITSGGLVVTRDTAVGWSVQKSLMGKPVYNDNNEPIGPISDLIIGPQGSIAYVVVAAADSSGGVHNLAVDANSLEVRDGKFHVGGATTDESSAAHENAPAAREHVRSNVNARADLDFVRF